MKFQISCRSTVSTAFARKPWLTVYRAHSGSCRYGFNKTFWIQQYSSPAGGNMTQIMTKIIWAIATLLLIITLNLTIRSRNPFVRTFSCIGVCCQTWVLELPIGQSPCCTKVSRDGPAFRIFDGFHEISVLTPFLGPPFPESLLTPRGCFWMPGLHL